MADACRGEFPCHIENYTHPPHDWTPITVDPEDDHVLHISEAVRCPGVPRYSPAQYEECMACGSHEHAMEDCPSAPNADRPYEVGDPAVQTSGVGADTGEAGCLPSPPSPRGGPPPRPTPEPGNTPGQGAAGEPS